ncbi:MAG: serine/threonine-protein phosphatase, partial [Demequina sp.]
RHRPTAGGTSAAGRAARLQPQSARVEDVDDDARGSGTWAKGKPWVLPLIALLVVAGAAWGAYRWTQTQYYVGSDGIDVAIYQGLPQDLPFIQLETLIEDTGIPVATLEPYQQQRIEDTIRAGSLEEAREIVESLTVAIHEVTPEPTPEPTSSPSASASTAAPSPEASASGRDG